MRKFGWACSYNHTFEPHFGGDPQQAIDFIQKCGFGAIIWQDFDSVEFWSPSQPPHHINNLKTIVDWCCENNVKITLVYAHDFSKNEKDTVENWIFQYLGAPKPELVHYLLGFEYQKWGADYTENRDRYLGLKNLAESYGFKFGGKRTITNIAERFGTSADNGRAWLDAQGHWELKHHNFCKLTDSVCDREMGYVAAPERDAYFTNNFGIDLGTWQGWYYLDVASVKDAIDYFLANTTEAPPKPVDSIFFHGILGDPSEFPQDIQTFFASIYSLYPGVFEGPTTPRGNLEIDVQGVKPDTEVTVRVVG